VSGYGDAKHRDGQLLESFLERRSSIDEPPVQAKPCPLPLQTRFSKGDMSIDKVPVVLSWSGGKDSAMVAYQLLASQKYEICALLTSVTEGIDRISMHGVRRELLNLQAEALGIPLHVVMIPGG
jgi:hypothetical protein